MMSRKEKRRMLKKTKGRKFATSAMLLGTLGSTFASPLMAFADDSTTTSSSSQFVSEQSENETQQSSEVVEQSSEVVEQSSEVFEQSSEVVEQTIESVEQSSEVVEPNIEKEDLILDDLKGATPQIANSRSAGMSSSDFLSQASAYAQQVASSNDLYASVMIAQAILESGWGGSTLSKAPNYNLFGIKGNYNGQSVTMATLEYENGKWITINAQFRKYPSFKESFEDNARVLKTTSFQNGVYFYSGAFKSNTSSYKDATLWLKGRYATDPNYNVSLNKLIETYNLTKYDTPNVNIPETSPETSPEIIPDSSTNSYYTVVSGDYLSKIASKYGTTVANLKSWNNLSSDLILVGQKLIVKKGTAIVEETKPVTPAPAPSTPAPTTPTTSESNVSKVFTTTEVLNIRKSSTITSSSLGYFTKGKEVKATKVNTNGYSIYGNKTWYFVDNKGWVSAYYLKEKEASNNSGNTSTPSTPTPTPSTPTTQNTTYKVKAGDTLSVIASRNGTTVANLKSWNNLKSDLILINQVLIVKKGTTTSTGTNTTVTTPTSTSKTHTVKSGDSLWAISIKYKVSIANIKSWNNLKSDTIYVNQKLVIK